MRPLYITVCITCNGKETQIFRPTGNVKKLERTLRKNVRLQTGQTSLEIQTYRTQAVSYTHLDVYKRQI